MLLRLPWRTWACPSGDRVCRWGSCLNCRGPDSTSFSGELVARTAGNMALFGFFPSLWLLCPSGDHVSRWRGSLDHGDPGNDRDAGVLSIATGGMVLVGFFLASGSSAPVRIERWHSCLNHGNAGGIKGTGISTALAAGVWSYQSFPGPWQLAIRGPLARVPCCMAHLGNYRTPGVLLCFSASQALTGSSGWGPE